MLDKKKRRVSPVNYNVLQPSTLLLLHDTGATNESGRLLLDVYHPNYGQHGWQSPGLTNSELLNIPRTMSAGHNHSLVSRRMTSARDRDRSDSRNLRTLSAVDGGKVKPILEKSRSSNPGQDRISYAELPIEETLMSSRGMVFSFEFLFLNI